MGGTILNIITVLIGTALGLLIGNRLPERIQQTVSRDSILPWHSVQFGWLPGPQDQFQLSLRARSDFGMDSYGNPAQIDCQLTAQDR